MMPVCQVLASGKLIETKNRIGNLYNKWIMEEKEDLDKDDLQNSNLTSEEPIENREESNGVENEEQREEQSAEDKLREENQELKDKYLRLYSEFENYRRRTAKERLDLIKSASEVLMTDLIPVVDDFERAIKTGESDPASLLEGNQLIYNKFLKVLESKGLKSMGDLVGAEFDAETQEAISMVPAPSEEMKGKVIEVVEKGYTLADRVIRYAKVVIGS